ncbi:hypothetical protein EB796_018334 [Bugula neritina]|uniref:Uncharacterized protein n=1 Tax=Bugula neritina TaxID=10212 RepID=A0A7J7JAT5_BUGNE|nr:hypothetical protein EB796_018334 [Bugula neritina]
MAVSLDTSTSNVRTFSVSTDPLTVGSRWKKWKRAFEYFVVGRGVTNAAQKKALLLNMAGEEVQDIFEVLPAGEGANEYARAMAALDTHFTPKTNIPYERSVFCSRADERVGRQSQTTSQDYDSLLLPANMTMWTM